MAKQNPNQPPNLKGNKGIAEIDDLKRAVGTNSKKKLDKPVVEDIIKTKAPEYQTDRSLENRLFVKELKEEEVRSSITKTAESEDDALPTPNVKGNKGTPDINDLRKAVRMDSKKKLDKPVVEDIIMTKVPEYQIDESLENRLFVKEPKEEEVRSSIPKTAEEEEPMKTKTFKNVSDRDRTVAMTEQSQPSNLKRGKNISEKK